MILKHLNYAFVSGERYGFSISTSKFYVDLMKETLSPHSSLLETYDYLMNKEMNGVDVIMEKPWMTFSFRTRPEKREVIVTTKSFHARLFDAFETMLEDAYFVVD